MAGMITGIAFTLSYIIYFQFNIPYIGKGTPDQYLFGITPEGIGFVGMLINFAVTLGLGYLLPAPPEIIQKMVDRIHVPTGAGSASNH